MTNTKVRTITVNQVGYPIEGRKIAKFVDQAGTFEVINDKTEEVVYVGQINPPISDVASGVTVASGEFTEVVQPGKYRIQKDGVVSASFIINDNPYEELHRGLFKAFYLFRCGMELTEEYAGPWKHEACHLSEGIVYGDSDTKLDSCGGWHDAGDYGKYTVAGAKAIADLLLAYELYPNAFKQPVPLPETDHITPDVLHECRYELEWLFKMQEEKTGGVFHKLTTLYFPGLAVMPEDDTNDLYFSPISGTATASFAAIMAMAARIYKTFDEGFAARCLHAANRAWDWLQANPEIPGFKNPPEISTGEYGDGNDQDERYWAAAELYRTTGDAQYHESFQFLSKKSFNKNALGWTDVGGYGTITYLLSGEENTNQLLFSELKEGLVHEASKLVEQSKKDGYNLSLTENQYIWGSNMLVMNHGMVLLFAYRLTGDKQFEECALEHVHYLMGRNVLDISYVTGFGDRAVMHPHHRPSVGDDVVEPVPGLVSGGPDRGLHDDYVREHLQGKPAAQCFADHDDSYSTNEVTIYWNSPAVFVVSHWQNKE